MPEKYEFGFEIHDPNSWTGAVTHKILTTEENLRQIHDTLTEVIEDIEVKRLEKTPRYRLAKHFATWGWGQEVALDDAWAQCGPENKQVYLKRADQLLADGWTHPDSEVVEEDVPTESVVDGYATGGVVDKPVLDAASFLAKVKFNDLADVMSGIEGSMSFKTLSEPERRRTMACKVIQWLMLEANK